MGNLFSVQCACSHAGLDGFVTSRRQDVLAADAVILPGIGAFGDAMATLVQLDLVSALQDVARSGKPLFGVCLGMQLLMTESEEFGCHKGLNLLEGAVVRLDEGQPAHRRMKVPHIGWNEIHPASADWASTPLEGLRPGSSMYFVHSYHVNPADHSSIVSVTPYGDVEICSSISRGNIFACQFHPERSGPTGLQLYRNLALRLGSPLEEPWTRK